MSTCTSCGHESTSTARFCSECGLPLVSPATAGAEVLGGTDKSHWLTSTPSSDDGAFRNPGVSRGFKHPVAAAAVGLIAAIFVWNLFRAPTVEVEGLAGGLADGSPSTIGGAARLGQADSGPDDDSDDDGVLNADDETATDTSTDTSTDSESTPAETWLSPVDVSGLDPALARYELLASRPGELLRVDLADGAVKSYEVTGELVGVFADRLYFVDSNTGITWRPVDDPTAEPVLLHGLPPENRDLQSYMVTADGILHLSYGLFDDTRFVYSGIRIDLQTGADQTYAPDGFGVFGLAWAPGAGLFEITEDGFRPLADATVRLPGERFIVVEACETPDRCRRYWLDRTSAAEVDRPVPDAEFGYVIGPSGPVVVTTDNGRPSYFSGETGIELPLEIETTDEPGLTVSEGLTPDERFLAVVDGFGAIDILIHDMVTDNQWVLELPRGRRFSKLAFVPEIDGGQ